MSAERLREAARVLRERAEGATPGPWTRDASYAGNGDLLSENIVHSQWDVASCHGADVAPEDGRHLQARADADYLSTMNPTVALAVADWLDATATRAVEIAGTLNNPAVRALLIEDNIPAWSEALATADAILAGVES